MGKTQVYAYICDRCGHKWVPRQQGVEPKVCPKCKSPYWSRPRQRKVKKNE